MRSQRPDNPFDAMRRVINHEANQDDDGGFFAKLGGIDPEPDDDEPTAKGLFQHMSRYETEDIVDNGAIVRTDITRATNTTGRPERVYTREEIQQTWDNLKMAMVPVMKDLVKVWDELRHNRKLMDTIAQLQAIDQGNRYWRDHQGQPRRNPTKRPLLQNGKAPR